jgi:riboflavin kinase / FMN adenylyltransferase
VLVVRNTKEFRIESPTIVTIGTFDGVHLGHQKILGRLRQLKATYGLTTVVLTFEPHPRKLLFPQQKDLKLLTSVDEKLQLLDNYGVDVAVVYPFDHQFAEISARDYVSEILAKNLKVKYLVIGYDHKFGRNRSGDIHVLRELSEEFAYEVEEIDAIDIESIAVSSSIIRQSLQKGDIHLSNCYLGHSYFLDAKVVQGKQLGRTIGYPTANLKVEEEDKLIPKTGIYFVEVLVDKKAHCGMMSIGFNPTTDTDAILKLEVHIFDFSGDIYDQIIRVNFLDYLREESKFDGLEELKEALGKDKKRCMELRKAAEDNFCTTNNN